MCLRSDAAPGQQCRPTGFSSMCRPGASSSRGPKPKMRHVVNSVTGLAIAYPEIAFTLSHNGREVHNLQRSDRKQRIETIFDLAADRNAIYVEKLTQGIGVHGFVGLPESARKSGARQALIVNGALGVSQGDLVCDLRRLRGPAAARPLPDLLHLSGGGPEPDRCERPSIETGGPLH